MKNLIKNNKNEKLACNIWKYTVFLLCEKSFLSEIINDFCVCLLCAFLKRNINNKTRRGEKWYERTVQVC